MDNREERGDIRLMPTRCFLVIHAMNPVSIRESAERE